VAASPEFPFFFIFTGTSFCALAEKGFLLMSDAGGRRAFCGVFFEAVHTTYDFTPPPTPPPHPPTLPPPPLPEPVRGLSVTVDCVLRWRGTSPGCVVKNTDTGGVGPAPNTTHHSDRIIWQFFVGLDRGTATESGPSIPNPICIGMGRSFRLGAHRRAILSGADTGSTDTGLFP